LPKTAFETAPITEVTELERKEPIADSPPMIFAEWSRTPRWLSPPENNLNNMNTPNKERRNESPKNIDNTGITIKRRAP
jgi:hypothetical protein